MTAIKTTNIVEGNLAQEPKYFPKGQYVARIVFRIMHTDRQDHLVQHAHLVGT